jgi:hypothetical protein
LFSARLWLPLPGYHAMTVQISAGGFGCIYRKRVILQAASGLLYFIQNFILYSVCRYYEKALLHHLILLRCHACIGTSTPA